MMKRAKYGNTKVKRIVNGEEVVFDSMKEARRFDDLFVLARAGKISQLTLQPKYQIVDSVTWEGATLRKRYYVPDFRYLEGDRLIVEDVKSEVTKKDSTYTLKKQLFLLIYGDKLTFRET